MQMQHKSLLFLSVIFVSANIHCMQREMVAGTLIVGDDAQTVAQAQKKAAAEEILKEAAAKVRELEIGEVECINEALIQKARCAQTGLGAVFLDTVLNAKIGEFYSHHATTYERAWLHEQNRRYNCETNNGQSVPECWYGWDVNDAETKKVYAAYRPKPIIAALRGLYARCADVNTKDAHGTNALMHAVKNTTKDMMVYLFEELLVMGILINAQDNEGYTALHIAALFDNKEAMRFLLERGADINLKTKNGASFADYLGALLESDSAILRKRKLECSIVYGQAQQAKEEAAAEPTDLWKSWLE